MIRIIPRHNVNLDGAEMATVLWHLLNPGALAGDDVRRFEDEFAARHGVERAVAVSSGRAALYAILAALDLSAGAEIVVPAYTFFTIPDVVRSAGFTPVFAPCHPFRYGLDPNGLESVLTPRTAAVIVEHPFGQPAPMEALLAVTQRHDVPIIEDPSQSIGATLDGRMTGSFGQAACFSFVHGKNLTTFGGGMILTPDDEIARRILARVLAAPPPDPVQVRSILRSGLVKWALSTRLGFAAGPFLPFYLLNLVDRDRLDALFEEPQTSFSPDALRSLSNVQSALGRIQLRNLDHRNRLRREHAAMLMEGLRGLDGLVLPEEEDGGTGTWNAFPVRVHDGRAFQKRLLLAGVDTRADYMSVFAFEADWRRHGDVVYLPNHPGLHRTDLEHVVRTVHRAMNK